MKRLPVERCRNFHYLFAGAVSWRVLAAGLLLGLLSIACLGADGDVDKVLRVKPDVTVSGRQVTLADLAENSAALPEGWGLRPIFDAPHPGITHIVPLQQVAYALQQYPDMANIMLRGSARMAVQRVGVPVDPAQVRSAVMSFVAQSSDCNETNIHVELMESAPPIMAGSANPTIEVIGFEYDPRNGAHLFKIELLDDTGAGQKIKIPVRVSLLSQVWVAARSIKAGTVLRAEDARIELAATDLSVRSAISVAEPIAGYETERQILAGEPILKTAVRQPVCAEKGSMVEIAARRGALTISLRAKAMCKGRRGDKIICINDGSKRQVLARLTAPGKADLIGL